MHKIGSRAARGHAGYSWLAGVPVIITAMSVFMATQPAQAAATEVNLGTAASFAVLGGSTVTNTGPTLISGGDLGLSPGTSVTGITPANFTPPAQEDLPDSAQAQTDLTAAYTQAMNETPATTIPGSAISGETLTPGIYSAAAALSVDGAVTLDAQGDPNAVFIFQVGSALTVGSVSAADFTLANGASACNVFWQVGSSATLDTGSDFVCSILASASISVLSGDTINGRLLARTGAVTLIDDAINAPDCAVPIPMASLPGIGLASGIGVLAVFGWFVARRRKTAGLRTAEL